ncbi:hypothetical protein KC960_01040 [Candidatus Saccharibacteria bacterium]|nr:hypothetical protein [Candidatus Saccharibacteria bacterium]MCB1712862.1 hypothetical protein [Candidatus Riesia sp.]
MTIENASPGYVWTEMQVPGFTDVASYDLRQLFPVPTVAKLQEVWEKRIFDRKVTSTGTQIPYTTFNPDAEQGTSVFFPGWGVTSLDRGGAKVASLIAAMNPGYRLIVPEELEGVSEYQKRAATEGFFGPYASNYKFIIPDKLQCGSGHSRGGIILSALAARGDTGIDTMNLMDVPGAIKRSPLKFAYEVGFKDNQVRKLYEDQIDNEEEQLVVDSLMSRIPNAPDPLKQVAKRGIDQWWLIRGMSKPLLPKLVLGVIRVQPDANTFIWHGTNNQGIPVSATRDMLATIFKETQKDGTLILPRYFESPTGHYADGHAARFARIIRFSIANTTR